VARALFRSPAGLVLAGMVVAGACGKRGDPLPPLSNLPQPITSLKLAQRGGMLEISYVTPRTTAGGLRLGLLDVEIARAETSGPWQKVAKKSRRRAAPGETLTETAPLPAPGTVVRVAIRAIERGHASAFTPLTTLVVQPPPSGPQHLSAELKGDFVALRWEGTVPSPPPSPSPSPHASGSPGAPVSPGSPAARATAASAALERSPPPVPAPAVGSAVATVNPPRSVIPTHAPSPLTSPTPPPITRGFLVYRRPDPGAYGAPLRAQPLTVNAIEDRTVALGQRFCYVVGTVIATEPVVESARSNEVCLAVTDIVPPAAPVGVAALGAPDGIEVTWSPSIETDLASYRLYRQAPGAAREAVGEVKPPETSLRDATAVRGTTYAYTVTAVDAAGNESPPSAAATAARP